MTPDLITEIDLFLPDDVEDAIIREPVARSILAPQEEENHKNAYDKARPVESKALFHVAHA
jgi:hypothetical protein